MTDKLTDDVRARQRPDVLSRLVRLRWGRAEGEAELARLLRGWAEEPPSEGKDWQLMAGHLREAADILDALRSTPETEGTARVDWEDEKRLREMRSLFVREGEDYWPYTCVLTRILDQLAASTRAASTEAGEGGERRESSGKNVEPAQPELASPLIALAEELSARAERIECVPPFSNSYADALREAAQLARDYARRIKERNRKE